MQNKFDRQKIETKLNGLAYRMLGNHSDAEDAVQDTWLKWEKVDPSTIQEAEAWLVTSLTRTCLDILKSSRKKREVYPGTWLPEPIIEHESFMGSSNPEENLLISESLTMAFMVMLDQLGPEERAVYLLAQVFGFPYAEIARILGKSEASCRKMRQRAQDKIRPEKKPAPQNNEQLDLLKKMFEAAANGERELLLSLLAEDAKFYSDGGGKVSAAKTVLTKPEEIAAMFLGLAKVAKRSGVNFVTRYCFINNRPGMIMFRQGDDGLQVETVFSADVDHLQVNNLYAVRNPDKLQHVSCD